MVFLDGYDGSDLHFRVTSRSRRGLEHVVFIRLDNGSIVCECENYVMGKNRGNFFDGTPGCFHSQIVARRLERLIDGPKPSLQDYASVIDSRFEI